MGRLGVRAAVVEGQYVPGDVEVVDGVVRGVGLEGPTRPRGLAVPGLLDLQVNGFDGVDFLHADEDEWRSAAAALARHGVTAYLAALITGDPESTRRSLQLASQVERTPGRGEARLVGAHLEGPFLSPLRAGTHPVDRLLSPSVPLLSTFLESGPVRLVTMAPELPGALDVIAWLAGEGVVVSLGHSDATSEQSHAGFAAGATSVTHVFNAMSVPSARAPGLAGAALVHEGVAVCLICDGVHVADDVVRLVHRAAGSRVVLVSDVIAAGGRRDGRYRLGEVEVDVADGAVRRADGTLAGSASTLADGFRRFVDAGVPLEDAVVAATSAPASLIGLDLPQLRPGDRADLVVMDDDLRVRSVLLAGEPVG